MTAWNQGGKKMLAAPTPVGRMTVIIDGEMLKCLGNDPGAMHRVRNNFPTSFCEGRRCLNCAYLLPQALPSSTPRAMLSMFSKFELSLSLSPSRHVHLRHQPTGPGSGYSLRVQMLKLE